MKARRTKSCIPLCVMVMAVVARVPWQQGRGNFVSALVVHHSCSLRLTPLGLPQQGGTNFVGQPSRRLPSRRSFYYSKTCLFSGKEVTATQDQEFLELKRQFEEACNLCEKNLASATPLHQLKAAVADLEREQSDPLFWNEGNSDRAAKVNAKFSEYSRLLSRFEKWQEWEGDARAALEMVSGNQNNSLLSKDERGMLLQECRQATSQLLSDAKNFELNLLLSGPYDQAPARLVLTAGAGGIEANSWVAELKRMYERHCEKMGFTCVTEDYQTGDATGYKSVDMLITGPNAYGWFQGEKGAHRLVRINPFSTNTKRQTTFAGVDVAPALLLGDNDTTAFDIPDKDLEITFVRGSGSGGQNVNKLSTAVRIKHLPSGLQVKCEQHRTQLQNKKLAMDRLKAQLLAIAQEQRVQEIAQIRGDMVEASWGAQIRNYVLYPYKLVKDQRSGWETSNAVAFLDGELLDECIGAYLRYKAQKEQEVHSPEL